MFGILNARNRSVEFAIDVLDITVAADLRCSRFTEPLLAGAWSKHVDGSRSSPSPPTEASSS